MPSATAKTSILAVGILAAAGAGIFLKPPPIRREAAGDRPAPPRPSLRTPARATPVRPAFAHAADPASQAWLDSLADLASRDPRQALAKLAVIGDPALRSYALASVAAGWARTEAGAAAQWVAELTPEGEATAAALGLIPVWAASAPTDCLYWANHRPPGTLREMSLVELADAWGSAQPQEALARFLALDSDSGSERGLQTIITQWALDAPQAAVESISRMDPASRRDEFLQAALVSLTNQDPDLAWKYADRFADPKTVEHVRGMALEAMAETRPQDAINLAATGGNGEVLLTGIARGWASADDAAAKIWIRGLADPDLAAKLLQAVDGASSGLRRDIHQ